MSKTIEQQVEELVEMFDVCSLDAIEESLKQNLQERDRIAREEEREKLKEEVVHTYEVWRTEHEQNRFEGESISFFALGYRLRCCFEALTTPLNHEKNQNK